LDFRASRFRPILLDVGNNNLGPLTSQTYSDGPSNTLSASGYNGNLIFKLHKNTP
jgi:hypothetical protein